jgi:hypothetical protein
MMPEVGSAQAARPREDATGVVLSRRSARTSNNVVICLISALRAACEVACGVFGQALLRLSPRCKFHRTHLEEQIVRVEFRQHRRRVCVLARWCSMYARIIPTQLLDLSRSCGNDRGQP